MTRAREDFARLLDGDETGSGPGGAARSLEALALARAQLDAATAVRPEFRDALRTRLLAVAAVQSEVRAPAVAPWSGGRARRRVAALSGALAGVVALTGVGVAASRSGPGDVFYAAKRTAESVRLGVAGGDAAEQGLRRLQLATTRLSELEALTARGRTVGLAASPAADGRPVAAGVGRDAVLDVLDDMDDDVRTGSALMLDAYRADGDRASLEVVRAWSVEQAARLRALLPRLSPVLQVRGEGSLALVRQVEADVVRLLAGPVPDDAGPVEVEDPLPPSTSSVVQDGPSASAVPTPATAPQGPVEDGVVQPWPAQPGTGPRPTSPVDGDDSPVSQPAVEDAPAPRPPPPPPLPPRADPPKTDVPLPEPYVPSAGLPTVDLPRLELPSVPDPLPSLPDLTVEDLPDGLPAAR